MRHIGLHLRLQDNLANLALKAKELSLPIFQCFFVYQLTGKFITVTEQEVADFTLHRRDFGNLYLHGSYWINLASLSHNGFWAFRQEFELAKRLSFTHIILHPGSARGLSNKTKGIDKLARNLNTIVAQDSSVKIVLENTAHKNLTVGSDIQDFKLLLEKLDFPERISFCIDTAHAFVYGYDIVSVEGREQFITLLDDAIGLNRIEILHINDTNQRLGSCIDRHALPGQGTIGLEPLKEFVNHPKLKHIPMIAEPPMANIEEEKELLALLRSW